MLDNLFQSQDEGDRLVQVEDQDGQRWNVKEVRIAPRGVDSGVVLVLGDRIPFDAPNGPAAR